MIGRIVLVFSVLGLVHSGVGQIIQSGQCDQLEPHPQFNPANFNPETFSGTWYEYRRSQNEYQSGDCASIELVVSAEGYQLSYPTVNANFLEETNATAVYNNGTATYSFNITSLTFDITIMRTDYNNYAVVYTCQNIGTNQRALTVWELLRQRAYPNTMIPALVNTTMVNSFGISVNDLVTISHSDSACYVLPIIPLGEPVVLPGQCNQNIDVVQNFDVTRFGGLWHETSAYYSEFSQNTCARAEYSLVNGLVEVENSQVVNQTLFIVSGSATASVDQSARLSVVLNIGNETVTSDLWILATDYTGYAVTYSCENLSNTTQRVNSWILSRSRQLSNESQVAVNSVIASELTLNNAYFRRTDQSDEACFFFPEADASRPVVFRGQCDMSIPAIANFDPVAYQGIWHDIESYPADFQTGTCRNADYTLSNATGVVDVLNTQVLGVSLDTITGTAVLASNDGSGLLTVSFPIPGTNNFTSSYYWILDTDYNSYALVYSCFNLNEDERRVFVWKLSRTKQLPAAANTAINNVMSNYTILDQRYFVPVDQSVDGCFYYPEPQPGVPVVFPGSCDPNVTVVQNFNLTQFDGIWYEIEAYPKDQQQGNCISHDYYPGVGNSLGLVSSQVVNQFLSVSNGTLSFNSTDNSARMQINIIANGEEITIPFWILSTDYMDYALAYSCVDRGDDFRAIYSWKLSRNRQLSANAVTSINNTVSSVTVLGDQYYESIDQSLDACFFLPELAPGEPVILVGQCDPNITVVQNFEAERYLGTWRLIESYPADFQTGACNQANYGATSLNRTVSVINTQVINQTLASTSGGQAVASADGSGRLLVTFAGSTQSQELLILDTDYDSYSLVYACSNIDNERRRVWSWKMSRTRSLSQNATIAINEVVNTVQVLNSRYYYTVDNSDAACFYYPEPDFSATGVLFRGTCDQNIPVVQNFSVVDYLGIWRNVELYPTNFQNGSCDTAEYSLGNGVVNVLNSQVVDETLYSIEGTAVVASNDSSARLIVSFPGPNGTTVETPLWVLATDYGNYSLAYSCVDVDEDHRRVWSWKLSRTRELTPQAELAIEEASRNIEVISQQYYVTADHSANGCFFYPEPVRGEPVRFPGQCSNNVPVVQNFSLTNFEGTWHEIQAYPKRQQQGECVSHEYTSSNNNTLDLRSFNVIGQTLGVTEGVLSFTSTDNSARMQITFNSNGTVITIPFWIVDTDYSDYALAYSCENDGPDFRYVYSWKLSRTRQLSANANVSISNASSTIDVLGDQYYETVDHSDNACFYLPEVSPGEEVIFPGQCDNNIPVVQNFSIADYTGRWFLIETYPSVHQSGSCGDATYTAGAGVVAVLNTQVVNQTLASATGTAVPASNDGSGRLLVTFEGSPVQSDYWVLDTDYTSYSLVYSCRNVDVDRRAVWAWKLSRTTSLAQNATNAINQVIDSVNVLENRYFEEIDRSEEGCFYYPTPDLSRPVRFRGRCNQNITVVQNFNATRYLGVWHNIELYPTAFQEGTCYNALYSLGDDGVAVLNTEVVNQTLFTINGLAVPAAADGSAILDVTFPNTNQTVPYWVLATDYDSYALVYSCIEIDEEYKNVWSWKLSRTRQLSNAAVTAINTAINQVQVLDSRYYRAADQSPEACFYYPEPQPGQVVRFPGRCDNNITVEQNFNLTLFQGVWHEIQAYPKEQQQGQCLSHEYSTGIGNTLNLISASVSNLTLALNNGTLRFTSTDNSARLTITITNSNGQDISIPFWVLDTDYDNYALAYACVDEETVNDMDYRRVFSWKLSRNRQLSANANAAINSTISTVDVLQNQYYEDIDQSDNACFFLPEVTPGEEVIFPGQCENNVPVVQNFSVADYTGRWFLIESYPSVNQRGTCDDATYTAGANNVVNVLNTQVVNQTLASVIGTAVAASNDGSGRLLVTFAGSSTPSDYWVLDTDYGSYSLVYSCRNINSDQRAVWSWKLSRTTSLTQNATNAINQVIDNVNVLDNRYYEEIDRSEQACFYFPESDLTSPIRFRGRCNQNINVVQNFNASRYLGVWHNIELYPTAFQEGTCNNALYSLSDDGVVVFNTEVVNQTLTTISGLAVPATNDSSAILDVTFPNAPQTVPYWVLATDYDSYALVYSCIEINEEYKNVWSWKLSRTRQLSNAAVTAINNAVNQVQVLDSRYYRVADQSPEGCFYYPEPQPGQVVRFPGRCDNNITVEQNFNITMFEGIWHEIQAYPKEQQTGQCLNHEYSAGAANTLDLISSSVSNLTLALSNGTLSFTSTDNSARLTITITNSNGQVINIPFWVLDTDYGDYALAYACVDEEPVNDMDYRRVFSWKLSRTKSLSAAANASINEVIDSVDVLHNQYYEDVDQSDEACFFMPDTAPGEPVIFPGQCDPNIPVVQNFNASGYLGRWRTIELYHTDFQDGECGEATYSANANGNVDVLNTQVINETLFSANGVAVPAADGSGRLEVTFDGSPVSSIYWVLDTDYDSYALVYTCRNINAEQRRVGAWKLSRDRTLSANASASIDQIISSINVLDNRYFRSEVQNDEACFYYPEPDGTPVVFRGQCDNNVTVVSNFNVTRYEGTWYDIESYPSRFQEGTCNTATYTLNGGVVEVVNTQVVDQELDTITATAVPAAADNSGRLIVTFPAGPNATIDVPYWVLDTDYDSYSFVYSCQNIDDEHRQVTSWKLSRAQTLSNTSSVAIDAVMSAVPVLRQQYFLQRNHSYDSCFYYPDNFGGPIIYHDGACPADNQVNTVANFNADRFTGTWHEVERFPSELQTGTCSASEYSIGSNGSSTITQSIVYNERELRFTGSAIIDANGRGIISVNINSTEVVINNRLYVIDTDYSEFALLYACRTLTNTSRQVYSWKLSRSRAGLSPSAIARINTVVREEVDLHRSYYEPTAQDNDACFFYPEFEQLPTSIQLPGPCPALPRVPNFNITNYVGQWFEIQRYPQRNQRGRCNRARYSELTSSSFGVYNYQVLETDNVPTLSSISGNAVVASTDGSGALTVTLQDGQRVSSLYVLDTDYNNYALLYNCRDLDNGWRQVASWKLSRSPSLSVASNNAINSVINRTQGLTQEYYLETNQTEEACFFVPSFTPNQRPQFRARCESITGIQQFNIDRYLGWWHEFESYATESSRGECSSSQYQTSGNTVQYVGTQVFGTSAQVTTGTVVVGPNGRLTKTLSNGQTEELWVVDTDYDTYSVVISCENVDDEFVRIWSAKYRKTATLTAAIENATNAVVASHPLLYQHLYQPVNQTDDACFHYPAPSGSRVVLRGQCDQNIPVQNNFNIGDYTGTWYQVERYPYAEVTEASTCIGTRYTLNEGTDVVTVLNWHVVGGDLRTVEGLGTMVGNARLQVQIPNPETNQTSTTDLYILGTDYVTYSLAYTCENINEFQRAVVAFKLSRSRTLPATGSTAINAIINSRQELHQPYFIPVEQHDDCDEPNSSYLMKSSIFVIVLCYAINMIM